MERTINIRLQGKNYFRLFFISFFLICSLLSCQQHNSSNKNLLYRLTCDASINTEHKSHLHSDNGEKRPIILLNGEITEEEFHSSPQSVKLSGDFKYSFSTTIDSLTENHFYRISIWRKDASRKSGFIVSTSPFSIPLLGPSSIIERDENGWEKIQQEFEVPPHITSIKIFVFLADAEVAYFDDLTIECYEKKEYPSFSTKERLHLYFSENDMNEFSEEKKDAFLEGVHFSNDNWTKGMLSNQEDVMPIKARLKGDWLDHLQGEKWSFRIKMRDGRVFNRMKSFSVQTPSSRYFLHEYLAHQLFSQEDILTTRYDFSPLLINGKNVGIYAIEEHFAKQLIEYNRRREGPILKFDENPIWRNAAFDHGANKIESPHGMPAFEVSRVLPFGKSKTVESPKLFSQFSIAHSLAYQYKNKLAPIEELFDIDKLAKYFALTDLINGKHGLAWHNQRFYYNPVICKLEPINYDNFTDEYLPTAKAYPKALEINKRMTINPERSIVISILSSEKFLPLYISYLKEYSKDSFVKSFYKKHEERVQNYLELMNQEFPEYHLDSNFLITTAKNIRNKIPELEKKYENGLFKNFQSTIKKPAITPMKDESIISSFINAYYSKGVTNGDLLIENYNGLPIEIVGLANEAGEVLYNFSSTIAVPAFEENYQDTSITNVPYYEKATELVVKLVDSSKLFYIELTPWAKNIQKTPYQHLLHANDARPNSLFTERNDSLILEKGFHQLSNKLLIPKNKVVVINAGVELDMVNTASIISESVVFFNGTEQEPIKIFSSDSSANGFVVLQAKRKSIVSHTTFSGLNTFDFRGWALSGAVNFYESDVDFIHCTFEKNLCEDALNIIRSHFNVNECRFYDIYADAFDSDFCTGTLSGAIFNRVGNDAIDFSTSQIKISDCIISTISDKGISGGEDSQLEVSNCNISNTNIGVASKDLSTVSLKNVAIYDCKYGLVALKKKPEYGGASIDGENLELKNCITDYLIEKKSVLKFNGKKISGTQKNVSKLFY